ncbi:MAG: hypothetical protein WC352_05395 [Candidatus Omnitrophota bacterium]|jgi:sulfite exporter TauE/SafE
MTHEFCVLLTAAVSLGFFHVLLGPDHTVPFIVMAKARKWPFAKTFAVTALCGCGHIGASVLLGLLGMRFGWKMMRLEALESVRGAWAGWALLIFGIVYLVYGMRKAFGILFRTENARVVLPRRTVRRKLAQGLPWSLFVIFVLGPCEPLIPLVMIPAARQNLWEMWAVTIVFGGTTVGTMLGLTAAGVYGLSRFSFVPLGRFRHALAGVVIFFCAAAVLFLEV